MGKKKQSNRTSTQFQTSTTAVDNRVAASNGIALGKNSNYFVQETDGGAFDVVSDVVRSSNDLIGGAVDDLTDTLERGDEIQYDTLNDAFRSNQSTINAALDFSENSVDQGFDAADNAQARAYDFAGDALNAVRETNRTASNLVANTKTLQLTGGESIQKYIPFALIAGAVLIMTRLR